MVQPPLTAEFSDAPESHDGSTAFTVRFAFSDDVDIEPAEMRDHALLVSVARRAIVTPQYRATSIAYCADRRATDVPNNASIRLARSSVALSSGAIRVGPYKESPRQGHSISARECACDGTCGRTRKSLRLLSAPKAIGNARKI